MSDFRYPIQVVIRRTGLTAFVIRVWEKRYGAVKPERTPTNRRLYSDEQIERLILLRTLTQKGQSIGYVAKLPTEQLVQLAQTAPESVPTSPPEASHEDVAAALVSESLAAVRALDARALEQTLVRAETTLGMMGMLRRVAAPLAKALGDHWRDGAITAAHEHFASADPAGLPLQASRQYTAGGPVLVVATPSGQLHELGALLVAALAANLGWQVTYLGASLPASEIAGAALQNRAKAVALSLVYPTDDPALDAELTRLRALLPEEIPLLVGGQATPAYAPTLSRLAAHQITDLSHLATTLDSLRQP